MGRHFMSYYSVTACPLNRFPADDQACSCLIPDPNLTNEQVRLNGVRRTR